MPRPALTAAALLVLASAAVADAEIVVKVERRKPEVAATNPPFAGKRAAVDVAILLDTSNSMDGLISQAKSQLWTIVQQFAKAKKDGHTPLLRVALFEYGNTRLPASEGYLRQVVPLTDDLDKLSEALFSLTTSGGDEYCGQVIDQAVTRLDWSKEPNGYKAIFIAGNEPFTQGTVDYHQACKRAIEKGIVVNTIHCGAASEGVDGKWQDGAQLAEGDFLNIDQDRVIAPIPCPQDKIIIQLSEDLNKTYLWFGARGQRESLARNQAEQDANAAAASPATAVSRAEIKATGYGGAGGSGGFYRYAGRDLIDSYADDATVLDKVKSADLPEELSSLSAEKRESYVKDLAAKRAALQKQIAELSEERAAYLAKEEERRSAEAGEATLGDAVVAAVRKQLDKNGFEHTAK